MEEGSMCTCLETSWTPVDKLNSALGFDLGDGSCDIFGRDVTTVQHTAGHELSISLVALHHLIVSFEA